MSMILGILQDIYHLRHVIDLRTHQETINDPDVDVPGSWLFGFWTFCS